jgi:hypothetical protein
MTLEVKSKICADINFDTNVGINFDLPKTQMV